MVLDSRYTIVAANPGVHGTVRPAGRRQQFRSRRARRPGHGTDDRQLAGGRLGRAGQAPPGRPAVTIRPGTALLISLAEAALDGVSRPSPAEGGLMVCPWFRIGGTVVRTIAMTARFDHIAEVTLDELRIELMYPLDDDAGRFFRAHDGQARLLAVI